jgi:SAM-dependent methyltransferase
VLDVGCGPGQYLALLNRLADVVAVGVDISEGMSREARVHAPTIVADAASLPFPAGAFDRVLAPHMLYHCADIAEAVGELRRVLALGGTLLAVVNSGEHMAELRALLRSITGADGLRINDRITLETGRAMFEDAFDEVAVERFASVLRVPEPAPVLDYIRSTTNWSGDLEPAVAAEAIEARVESVIAREGVFTIRSCAGVFLCR